VRYFAVTPLALSFDTHRGPGKPARLAPTTGLEFSAAAQDLTDCYTHLGIDDIDSGRDVVPYKMP